MPLSALQCPTTLREVPLAEAPAYFEAAGLMPAEAVRAIIRAQVGDAADPYHGGAHVTASAVDPTATCKRGVAIERFLPYSCSPFRFWAAEEGTLFHSVMEQAGDASVYIYERRTATVELFGVPISARVDRSTHDFREVVDYKVTKQGKVDYGLKDGWALQLQVIGLILQREHGLAAPPALKVWRRYNGALKDEQVWKLFLVPPPDPERLESRIGPHLRDLHSILSRCEALRAAGEEQPLCDYIASLPLDGQSQFNGKHCQFYCRVKGACDRLAGCAF